MKKTGFTLIELLVVIAIIAILAAILFPVFSSAKEQGWRASCASNERNLLAAISMYVDNYDGTYPKANMGYPKRMWYHLIDPYVKNKRIYICPVVKTNRNVAEYSKGSSFYGYDCCYGWNIGVKMWSYDGVSYNYWTSGMGYVDQRWQKGDYDNQPYVKQGTLTNTSKIILIGDLTPTDYSKTGTPNNIYLWLDKESKSYTPHLHNNGANYGYVDGHVKYMTQNEAFAHPELFTRFND